MVQRHDSSSYSYSSSYSAVLTADDEYEDGDEDDSGPHCSHAKSQVKKIVGCLAQRQLKRFDAGSLGM